MNRSIEFITLPLLASMACALVVVPHVASAQSAGRGVQMDSARATALYVSNRPEDLPQGNFERQIVSRKSTDSTYAAHAPGAYGFSQVTYRSSEGGLEIPAYLFTPTQKRGRHGHAAMVWVHGGVHSNWSRTMLPFVKEAVERGYVIITPQYRGSTGYGTALYNAIDYGGKELDDVQSAVDHLKTLPYVDPERIGIMGWSHGGFITAHLLMRGHDVPFKAGAAIVPVTNLVFRLSYKGPYYQRHYATQAGIGGLPFEKRDEYIKRSPLYHVDSLFTPILVHVATNDEDVNFVEDQQLVDALRSRKSDLADTKVYVDPPGWGSSVGHTFDRRVDPRTLQRDDSPAQLDSWNRIWTFFEWHLRPYEDRSKPIPPPRVRP